MIKVFLSLGSDLGNKRENLNKAISEIELSIGEINTISGIYETEAWGFESKSNFLNQVILIETEIDPFHLIHSCLDIERKMGRERKQTGYYESRVIDIDILFYGESIVDDDNLTIPHQHLHKRRFILEPLNEIAPDFIHPLLGKSISELLAACDDTGLVKLY